ncbi:MAG: hypothetical protein AAF664_22110, partial [Planctomycetota bacterium]
AINLLAAQSALQNSLNSFLSASLDYYAARLRLFRELGVMQLDSSGSWIEDAVQFTPSDTASSIDQPVELLPPELPFQMLEVDELPRADGANSRNGMLPNQGVIVSSRTMGTPSNGGDSEVSIVRVAEKIKAVSSNP